MSDEPTPVDDYSKEAALLGRHLLLLLLSDAPLSLILKALEEFKEQVEEEVS